MKASTHINLVNCLVNKWPKWFNLPGAVGLLLKHSILIEIGILTVSKRLSSIKVDSSDSRMCRQLEVFIQRLINRLLINKWCLVISHFIKPILNIIKWHYRLIFILTIEIFYFVDPSPINKALIFQNSVYECDILIVFLIKSYLLNGARDKIMDTYIWLSAHYLLVERRCTLP